ncbi:MAG: type I methionyl aminopeptidase [Patescibacteria group bacterium]
MIPIKQAEDISVIAQGGKKLSLVMATLIKEISAGLNNTADINTRAEELIKEAKAEPAFKGYRDYPATICLSINDEVVHGIPAGDKNIAKGDLVSIDIGLLYRGWYSDMAESFIYGGARENKAGEKLISAVREALFLGIKQAKEGNRVSDISRAVQDYVEAKNYGVVRDLVGHGIGRQLHESPSIPNFISDKPSPALKNGMTIAIEPMITAGSWRVMTRSDGWTVVTADHKLAAHIERTVAVTAQGPVILTPFK